MTVTTTTGAEVAVVEPRPAAVLAVADGQTRWAPEQLAALEQLGVAGADDGNLAVFLHQAQRTGLDPFAKQIYMIGRNSKENVRLPDGSWTERWVTKYTIQTGINGYRTLAHRAARRDGSSYTYGGDTRADPAAEWCGQDGVWRDVWVKSEAPAAARFTIVKTDAQGRVERYTATCRLGAYIQTKNGKPVGRWAYAADQMLSKCAEALALQMAYPQDYSGVEYEGAMDHLDSDGRAVGGPQTARDRIAARSTVIVGEPADSRDPGGWVEETFAEIRAAATVDLWKKANAKVAHAEKEGLDPQIVEAMRAELVAQREQLPAPQSKLTRMYAALGAVGITDKNREQKLTAISNVIRRKVTSGSQLTGAEADQVWEAVAKAQQTGDMAILFPPAAADSEVPDAEPVDDPDGASPDDEDWTDERSPEEIAEASNG